MVVLQAFIKLTALSLCNVSLKQISLTCTHGSKREREKRDNSEYIIFQIKVWIFVSWGLCHSTTRSTLTPLFPAGSCRSRSPALAWSWCPAASCSPGPAVRCWHVRCLDLLQACWLCSGSRRAWRCNEHLSLPTCSPGLLSVREKVEISWVHACEWQHRKTILLIVVAWGVTV